MARSRTARIPFLTPNWLLAILVVLALITTVVGPGLARRLRGATRWALAPLGDAGTLVSTAARKRTSQIAAEKLTPRQVEDLRRQNEQMRRMVQVFARRFQRYRRAKASTRRLYGQIEPLEFEFDLVAARVVGTGSLPYGSTRMINQGTAAGVQVGARVTTRRLLTDRMKALRIPPKLAALAPQAMVGWVTEAWALGAELQLVTDDGFRIAAIVNRRVDQRTIKVIERGNASIQRLSRETYEDVPVIATGNGKDRMIVRDVSVDFNVRPDDLLLTRAESYFLPERFPLGVVEKVTPQPKTPGFVQLVVKPAADLDALRRVYVIVPTAPARQEP
jgi:cell shape-determining protein MreC